jgi:hypothetical protein
MDETVKITRELLTFTWEVVTWLRRLVAGL